MTKFAIKYALMFVLLVTAQAVLFNHLILFDVAVPLVFIYLIVFLPVTFGTNLSVTLSFLAGFLLDIFCDTPGVNALCSTLVSFSRKSIFHLYVSIDDDLAGRSPSTRTMGMAAFMKYLITITALYCTLYFTVEAFQFFNFRLLVLRVLASTAYSFVLLYAIDCVSFRSREQ